MFWREAGLNYLRYSAIAAQQVRAVLRVSSPVPQCALNDAFVQKDLQSDAEKRAGQLVRVTKWANGKMIKE